MTVNGVVITATATWSTSRRDTVGLFDSLRPGDTATVATEHVTWKAYRKTGLSTAPLGGALAAGESVRVLVNGVEVAATVSGSTVSFDAGTQRDGLASYVVVEVTRVVTQTFALPQSSDSDDDVVDARTSTLPLVVFGGQGRDTIHGGSGGDIIFGDRGRVLWFTPGTVPVTGLGGVVLTAEQVAQLEQAAVAVSGHGGVGDLTDGVEGQLVGLVVTLDPTIGGDDVLSSGSGRDVLLGGAGGDTISTSRDATDAADIVLGDHGFVDWVLRDGDPTDLDRIWSTQPDLGGNDTITTGAGDDVVVGGAGDDTVRAGEGNNVVLGDSGRITAADADTLRWFRLPMTLGRVETTDPTLGGRDDITTGAGFDIVLGGAAGDTVHSGDGTGIVLGDHGFVDWDDDGDASDIDAIWTTDRTDGAGDALYSGAGDDVVIGGFGGDTIDAGDGRNVVLGDNGRVTAAATDGPAWSQVPMTIGRVETTDSEVGGRDDITTGTGVDVVLGGADGDTVHAGSEPPAVGTASGTGDIVLGDNGFLVWAAVRLPGSSTTTRQVVTLATVDDAIGGADRIYGQGGEDVLVGGTRGDSIDGGLGRDLVLGDNALLDRSTTYGDYRNPRFRALTGNQVYDTSSGPNAGGANVGTAWGTDPRGTGIWGDFRVTLYDHAWNTSPDLYGADYLAGGGQDDMIFGQLGDDTIQGDGSIDQTVGACRFSAVTGTCTGRSRDVLVVMPSTEAATDGDDYVEGGGGRDVVFGNLGRDDLVGGSSDMFSLDSMGLRPDDSDLVFGGAGLRNGRNDAVPGHGTDSDTIVGDNGDIQRLVGRNNTIGTSYLTFTYDTYTGDTVRLLPRAVTLLDYTPGGPDFRPSWFPGSTATGYDVSGAGTGTYDVWGSDELHGEGGDDTVYAGGGNDVVYGDAGDDDLVGGWGSDWLSGGTGVDGVLGDDGRILTSRNGSTELLNGLATANKQVDISTPGNAQEAVLYPTGWLNKSVDLTPYSLDPSGRADNPLFAPRFANDVIYGGLDADFLHGGAGDDAVSGAEALMTSYAPTYAGGVVQTDWAHPFNDGRLLGFDTATGMFPLYDANDPRRKVLLTATGGLSKDGTGLEFFLNNDPTEGKPYGSLASDGFDVLFGDHGNDWLVGGTGRDTLWGGWGNDLLQADDDLNSYGGRNDGTDTAPSYEDRVFGGAGLDVMIANTGGDRLIDWGGEFNTYLVPFSPYGEPTVSRTVAPALYDFLYQVSKAQGADQTGSQELAGGTADRNGEPFGEIGLVTQQDAAWGDQHGGPRDPQAGNLNGTRDVRVNTSDAAFLDVANQNGSAPVDASVPALTELPVVTISSVTVTEGNSGTKTVTLTVTLSRASNTGAPVHVHWTVNDVTATAGSDYVATSGDLTFTGTQTTKTITVSVLGDTVPELDESFTVDLVSVDNATVAQGTGTVTLTNDDAWPPTISIGSVSVLEGKTGSVTVTVPVTLSTTYPGTVTVTVQLTGGSATAGSDYKAWAAPVTLTFTAGQTTKTVSIVVYGDRTVEPDETVQLTLTNPVNAVLGTSTGTVTILDDDAALQVAAVGTATRSAAPTATAVRRVLALAARYWRLSRADLRSIHVVVADLPQTEVAHSEAGTRTITLDTSGAGWGWSTSAGRVTPHRIDLLSVLVHEIGHLLGRSHAETGVMTDRITPGRRYAALRHGIRAARRHRLPMLSA